MGFVSFTSSKESLLLSFTKVGILFLAWQLELTGHAET